MFGGGCCELNWANPAAASIRSSGISGFLIEVLFCKNCPLELPDEFIEYVTGGVITLLLEYPPVLGV